MRRRRCSLLSQHALYDVQSVRDVHPRGGHKVHLASVPQLALERLAGLTTHSIHLHLTRRVIIIATDNAVISLYLCIYGFYGFQNLIVVADNNNTVVLYLYIHGFQLLLILIIKRDDGAQS